MNTPVATFRRLLVILLATLPLSSLRADLEFVGILVTPQKKLFALADPAASGKKDWVALGGTFAGHTVSGYDAKDDTLTLTRDGTDLRVRLKDDAKVKSARLELSGTITFGATEKIEVERATLQFDQENVFPLKDGLTYRITPTRGDDGNIRYAVTVERKISENKTETVSAPAITTLPGQPFKLFMDDLGFAFTPR